MAERLESSTSGTFKDHIFEFPVRVYYEDTDAQGLVFYINYLKYTERARTELFRTLDMSPSKIQQNEGRLLVVRKCEITYERAAKLDDLITVETEILAVRGARLHLRQDVMLGDQRLVATWVELAVIDEHGKTVRLPRLVKDRLLALLDK